MSFKCLSALLILATVATAVVIKTDAQVHATIAVQGATDQRAFRVNQFLSWVSAFGLTAQTNISTGTINNNKNLVYVRSSGGLLARPAIEYGTYASSSSFDLNAGTATASASSVYTAFRPLAVVQYLDNNNNGKYDIGEESDVMGLGGRSYSVTITKTNGAATDVFLVSYDNTNFGFRYSVQNRPVVNQGARVDEDGTKIDIWIRPRNSLANSKIALISTYTVIQADANVGGSANNGNVTVTGNGKVQYSRSGSTVGLSWAATAKVSDQSSNSGDSKVTADVLTISTSASLTINGVTIIDANVIAAIPKMLVFNFDATNPSEIYWDPYMGPGNSAASVVLSVVAVIFALALVI